MSGDLHPLVDAMATGVIDRERSGAGHHEGERPDQDEQRILVTADDRASRGRIDDRAVQEKTLWPAEQEQRSEEHTSELQSHHDLVCRLLLEKKKLSALTLGNGQNYENHMTSNVRS